jgi:hypothetical protein
MRAMIRRLVLVTAVVALPSAAWSKAKAGDVSLFNGKDLSGWVIPAGDNGHWKVTGGVIDYDALSESKEKDKSLWSEKEFGDFQLHVEWRLKETPFVNPNVPIILPDGSHKMSPDGKEIHVPQPDSDSGIYVRGSSKAQINIWCWPIGSGEVYGYRMDKAMPPEVRAGVTPKKKADKPVGEWNAFDITMKGDRLTVVLNGAKVIDNAQLPGVAARGKIALQSHGSQKEGKWVSPPSLVQFRNVKIKEL